MSINTTENISQHHHHRHHHHHDGHHHHHRHYHGHQHHHHNLRRQIIEKVAWIWGIAFAFVIPQVVIMMIIVLVNDNG